MEAIAYVGVAGWIGCCGWLVFEALRYRRKVQSLEREAYERRPLMSDERLMALRPGDTVLITPPLGDMTLHQQFALISLMEKNALSLKKRGVDIEFIVVPDFGQNPVIVVSRSGLQKHHVDDDLACAQAEAERLGLTPLHADYPSDTRLGVEPGEWRLKWPAAKQRVEREMAKNT